MTTTAILTLQGCLSGEEQATDPVDPTASVRLNGSVGDGPIVNATIEVRSVDGVLLVESSSNSRAEYDVLVDATADEYPLVIASSGGVDLVTDAGPEFALYGVATTPGQSTTANINPLSTFVLEIARELPGGLTGANVDVAKTTLDESFDFGLVTLDTDGALYESIDETNVSEIIRASEAMGEVIRRTRDRLAANGNPTTSDNIVWAIASDLVDGDIDGVGGGRVDSRISALATVIISEVLLESMQAELRVGGLIANSAMNNAADIVTDSTVSLRVEDLPVTRSMSRLAQLGVSAGAAVSTDSTLDSIVAALSGIQDGMSPSLVRTILPADFEPSVSALADFIARADQATIDSINAVVGGRTVSENSAPTISGVPSTSVTAGNAWAFVPTANDADQDTLLFSIAGQPSWTSFNANTGRISGTPSENDVGTFADIRISVTDGTDTASLPAFTLVVNSTTTDNNAPTIAGQPDLTVSAGDNYIFVPTASDADGDSLTFNVANLPSWASFNPNNGAISGSPGEQHVGVFADVEISVSDGQSTSSLAPFDVVVITSIVPNSPPTIIGTPATTVAVGNAYVFQPTATDVDGDGLTFFISGLPVWASFDFVSGAISGSPDEADVGTYSNVVISVSDGTETAQLAPFSITVVSVALGSATVSWVAPTEYEDGSPLTDLAGFRVYWGTSAGNYPNSVTVNNPGQTNVVIENLSPGNYEFVTTAFNEAGVESLYSNPAFKTID
ncbi:MAG: putative Ig domain-containing protein [Pseudomonadota bacterium]